MKDKNLWTVKAYKNFVARVDWRIKSTPYINRNMRIVMPDGHDKLDENGKVINIAGPDSDSGFILRGSGKAQLNIWCWPVGSGEMYGYRTDPKMPPEVRAAATPKVNADKDIGQWNTFEVTVQGSTCERGRQRQDRDRENHAARTCPRKGRSGCSTTAA